MCCQAAHVGIGVSGVEGLQAACASDFAIAQVLFLYVLWLKLFQNCLN